MDYPKPSIAADIVLIERRTGDVCLIERLREPFAGSWAVMGGFFNPVDTPKEKADVNIEAAAWRELREEIGFDAETSPFVRRKGFSHHRDAIGRDPRGRTVAFVYYVIVSEKPELHAKDDAKSFKWFPLTDLLNGNVPLAFDHLDLIREVQHEL